MTKLSNHDQPKHIFHFNYSIETQREKASKQISKQKQLKINNKLEELLQRD